jgi:hypothetical protein
MAYLGAVLDKRDGNYRAFLRREGFMEKLVEREAELENNSS